MLRLVHAAPALRRPDPAPVRGTSLADAALAFLRDHASSAPEPMLRDAADLVAAFGFTRARADLETGFGLQRRTRVVFDIAHAALRAEPPHIAALAAQAARRRHQPFHLHDLPDARGAQGLAVPIHAPGWLGLIVLFGAPRTPLDHAETALLAAALGLVFEKQREHLCRRDADELALTRRERDCMGQVALGRNDEEIAAVLGISRATVRHHVDNVREKLGAATRAEAVARLSLAAAL